MVRSDRLFFALHPSEVHAAKRALVYSGPGACDGCYQAASDMALRAGLDPTYVGEEDLNASSTPEDKKRLFKGVVLWLQPGGKSSISMDLLHRLKKIPGCGPENS